MEITDLTQTELLQGWHLKKQDAVCNYCQKHFDPTVIAEHLAEAHGGNIAPLIRLDNKYNTLTDVQKDLLLDFAADLKDKEIAERNQVSGSTIRQQKYRFREKAKQAKLYLAQYQAVFGSLEEDSGYLPIPDQIKEPDARFQISEKEYRAYLDQYGDLTADSFVLKMLPRSQKKIIALLYRISEEFDFERNYSAKEIDERLKAIYFDYILIKRYLIDYKFLDRTTDGQRYWRIF